MADLTTLADAYHLPRVREAPSGGRDAMAQIAAYEERTKAHPDRDHWSLVDQTDPGDDGPAAVLDGDLDRWKRLASGPNRGLWRMVNYTPGQHEERAGEALPWQQLALHYAPLTAATEEDR